MLHVRKYRMKHNLKDECYAPCEHWHCIENPNPIANGSWKILLDYTEKFISPLDISNIFRKVMHILVNDMACPKRCNGKLFLAYI